MGYVPLCKDRIIRCYDPLSWWNLFKFNFGLGRNVCADCAWEDLRTVKLYRRDGQPWRCELHFREAHPGWTWKWRSMGPERGTPYFEPPRNPPTGGLSVRPPKRHCCCCRCREGGDRVEEKRQEEGQEGQVARLGGAS